MYRSSLRRNNWCKSILNNIVRIYLGVRKWTYGKYYNKNDKYINVNINILDVVLKYYIEEYIKG